MTGHLSSFKSRNIEQLDSSELDKRLLELSALFEISKTLNSSLDLKSILDNLLLVPMGRMMISKGIVLFHRKKEQYVLKHLKGLSHTLLEQQVNIEQFPESPVVLSAVDSTEKWIHFFKELQIELLVPISSSIQFKGLLGYGKKLSGQPYTEDELQFLTSLGNIAAQSIENANMINQLNTANRSLDQKVQELNTLFEIGRELNQIFDPPSILKQLSFSLMGQMLVNQFLVVLKKEGLLEIVYRMGSKFGPQQMEDCTKICSDIGDIEYPIILSSDNKYGILRELGISVVVPMAHKNEINGYIFLGDKLNKSAFKKADLSFLSTLANMVIISLENSRLIRETIEKERMEEELNLAKTIQKRLLPEKMPTITNYDIHGMNLSSKQVGGDYFDIIPLGSNEYIFTIADVSGKGMPAALLMSNLQAGLHSLAGEQYSLEQTTAKLNNLIHRNTTIDKYITFFIMQLNTKTGTFQFVNAGHNPPYLINRNKEFMSLDDGGLILGMMPNVSYNLGNGQISSGECIVMFTDGVTEAMNEDEQEFSESGVISFFKKRFGTENSEDLNNQLLEELNKFSNGDPTRGDDITVLTIQSLE